MMVGKILCYLYLSPEAPANEGIFTQQGALHDELLTTADESQAAEAGEQSFHRFGSGPPEAARKNARANRLRRLGMVWFMGHDSSKFRITESVFRFGADVRAGD